MKQINRSISLIMVLSLILSLMACNSTKAADKAVSTSALSELNEFIPEEGFTKTYSSGDKILMLNEKTAEIAVKDIESDYIWYSNPQNRTEDSVANEENQQILASQVIIDYQNSMNQSSTMYSNKHSVALGNYNCNPIKNGFEVIYHIGNEIEDAGLPKALTVKRYEELYDAMEKSDRSFLSRQYSLIKYESLTEGETKDSLLEKYPGIKNQDLYILRSSNKNIYTKLRTLLQSNGYTNEDLINDHKDAEYTYESENPVFQIVVQYEIKNSEFIVTVPFERLYAPSGYIITNISLLPYFASQGKDAAGEMILPDGSGSVMKLNNGKVNEIPYEVKVYGGNIANYNFTGSYVKRVAHLPIYGISADDNSMFAVIEDGKTLATIKAQVSGTISENNTVYSSFQLSESEEYQVGSNVGAQISFYSNATSKENLCVRYTLWGKKVTYSEMAKHYREYLKSNDMLDEKKADFSGVYVNLTGAISYETSFLGIPYNKLFALTKYSEAIEIIKSLKEAGIDDIHLSYDAWNKGGNEQCTVSNVSPESVLGSKKEFKEFINYCNLEGIKLNLQYEMQLAGKEDELFDGFSKSSEAVKTVTGKYGRYISSYRKDTHVAEDMLFVFKPTLYKDFANSIVEDFKKWQLNAVNVGNLSSHLVADYSKDEEILLSDCVPKVTSALKTFSENGLSVTAKNANDYSLKYIDNYVGMDIQSADYAVTDYSIPFLQMVIGDTASYSGEFYNYDAPEINVLKCIETGSNLCIDLIYVKNTELKNKVGIDKYYSSHYEDWVSSFADANRKISEFRDKVGDAAISAHQTINKNISIVTYGNKRVIVNMTNADFVYNNITVKAKSYHIL